MIISILGDILGSLALSRAPGVYETVVRQALPPLCHALESTTSGQSWIQSSAIDLLCSLVSGPEEGLGEGFVAVLAPRLFGCLQTSDDRDVLQVLLFVPFGSRESSTQICQQSGIRCLTAIIQKDCGQLSAWTDSSGRSGLGNVLMIVVKLLQNQDESGGLVIGDLIIQMLRRAGEAILPVLPELLQVMLGRMRTAVTATFTQVRVPYPTPTDGCPNSYKYTHRALSFHLRCSFTTSGTPSWLFWNRSRWATARGSMS